ncbi:MAG TPA: hypothetical protein VMG11_03385 [Steroidobacteraceae bacterium]|nr:hypothetical protein [Steroidobacteraceae bacterium]
MLRAVSGCIIFLIAALTLGCATSPPEDQKVMFTKNPSYVASCTPLGNVSAEALYGGDPQAAEKEARALNANWVLAVGGVGVAYHCGK